MTELVRLDGVHRRYRLRAETIHAVNDATFSLGAGTVTVVVGPSGSGKTTLVNLVVGWDRPDDGRVTRSEVIGDDWGSISVVPQGLGLLPELSLLENIELPTRLGNEQQWPTGDLIDALGLSGLEDRVPDEASLGEQQRTAVARALVSGPLLLVADEPTAHQDEANAELIGRLLRGAADAGSAVLMATHDPRMLLEVDRVLEIRDGRVHAVDRS